MKIKLLKKLRKKHQIREQEVHIIKILYSVTPLHRCWKCNEFEIPFSTYSYKEAKKKQRELILDSLKKYL